MRYRILGKTGVPVSEIGLGTWQLGDADWGVVGEEQAIRILHRSVDLGVNFCDTADVYGLGLSERTIGRFLRETRQPVHVATKLGRTIIPVVENFSELALILKHARAYDVRPRIGVRVKLASEGAGRWRESSGEKSKFGLFVTEILELFRVLKEQGMEDCLQLVHCHPGSQLQDIRRVKDAVKLAAPSAVLGRCTSRHPTG